MRLVFFKIQSNGNYAKIVLKYKAMSFVIGLKVGVLRLWLANGKMTSQSEPECTPFIMPSSVTGCKCVCFGSE